MLTRWRSAVLESSTSPREILPILYGLAGVAVPTLAPGMDYPGYPLVASGYAALPWFFGVLPFLILVAWWWSNRPPRIRASFVAAGDQS